MDESQKPVTGTARLKLYKGNITVAGRKAPHSLYRPDLATFEAGGTYRQADATGFIRLNALRLKIRAQLAGEVSGLGEFWDPFIFSPLPQILVPQGHLLTQLPPNVRHILAGICLGMGGLMHFWWKGPNSWIGVRTPWTFADRLHLGPILEPGHVHADEHGAGGPVVHGPFLRHAGRQL